MSLYHHTLVDHLKFDLKLHFILPHNNMCINVVSGNSNYRNTTTGELAAPIKSFLSQVYSGIDTTEASFRIWPLKQIPHSLRWMDQWAPYKHLMPVDDLTRLMDRERVLSFPHICEHITLHDPANIHIPLAETRREWVSYRDESGKKERKREKRMERKRRDKPVHFSWHWLTCSYTIVEWGQSGKISHPLHGRTECQASERGQRVSIWETRNKETSLHFFWQRVRWREEKRFAKSFSHLLKAQNSYSA